MLRAEFFTEPIVDRFLQAGDEESGLVDKTDKGS
jgi:hypothetical protein